MNESSKISGQNGGKNEHLANIILPSSSNVPEKKKPPSAAESENDVSENERKESQKSPLISSTSPAPSSSTATTPNLSASTAHVPSTSSSYIASTAHTPSEIPSTPASATTHQTVSTAHPPAPTIITAEDSEPPPTDEMDGKQSKNSKAVLQEEGSKCNDRDILKFRKRLGVQKDDKDQVVFPSKRPNHVVMDKKRFDELLEYRDKLKRLRRKHKCCTPPQMTKLRLKEEWEKAQSYAEERIVEKFEREAEKLKHDDEYMYKIKNKKMQKHIRRDYVRGYECEVSTSCRTDNTDLDPLRISRNRVDALKHIHDIGKEIYRREVRRLPKDFYFLKTIYSLRHLIHHFGQYWALASPMYHVIPIDCNKSQFLLANFTCRRLYVKLRFSTCANFTTTPPNIRELKPFEKIEVTFRITLTDEFLHPFQRLVIYYQDYEDFQRIRRRTSELVDIRGHQTGKMVLPIFIENWNDQRIPPETFLFDERIKCYMGRLEKKLKDHKKANADKEYEMELKFVRALSDKEYRRQEEKKNHQRKKQQAREDEKRKMTRKKKHGEKKSKDKKKRKKKEATIQADETSMTIKPGASVSTDVSHASVNRRDMAKEWAKTRK